MYTPTPSSGTQSSPAIPETSSSAIGLALGQQLIEGVNLTKRIGGDVTGEVWQASVDDTVLAVRIVPYTGKEVLCEAEVLCEKDWYHPYFVRGYSPGLVSGNALFFMELADESLQGGLDKIRAAGGNGYPPAELLGHLRGVASALDYLVQRKPTSKLLYGAVRPSRLLRFGKTVKLGGFDQVRFFRSELDPPGVPLNDENASPEMAEGRPSQRSDQYSLALTYLELRGGLAAMSEDEKRVLVPALAEDYRLRYPSCSWLIAKLQDATCCPPVAEVPDNVAIRRAAKHEEVKWKLLRRNLDIPGEWTEYLAFVRRGGIAALYMANVEQKKPITLSCDPK